MVSSVCERGSIYQTGVSHSFLGRRMDGLLTHMFSLTAQPVAQPRFHTPVIYLCIYIRGLSAHHVHSSPASAHLLFP